MTNIVLNYKNGIQALHTVPDWLGNLHMLRVPYRPLPVTVEPAYGDIPPIEVNCQYHVFELHYENNQGRWFKEV